MAIQPKLDDLLELRHQAHSLGTTSHHLVNTSFSGLYASVFKGQGLNFEEVREYQAGDDVRNMEWKVTARTGVPQMKIFREERERQVVLFVDQSAAMQFGTREIFKSVHAAHAAALLGWAANAQHDRVGGLLFGGEKGVVYFRPSKGQGSLWKMLKQLAETKPKNASHDFLLTDALQHALMGTENGSLIFIIADFNALPEDLDKHLGRLAQRHTVVVLPVDDLADQFLPDMGKVVFSGADGQLVKIDTADAKGRLAYTANWQQTRDELIRITRRLGIQMIPLETHIDIHLSLRDGLTR